jgi:hypothetical protein
MSENTSAKQLEDVRKQFERWRRSRTRSQRIPDELWELAVGLVNDTDYTYKQIASALRLNQSDLKRRIDNPPSRLPTVAEEIIDFIPLATSPAPSLGACSPSSATTCFIELHKPDGWVMKIEATGYQTSPVVELTRLFLEVKP